MLAKHRTTQQEYAIKILDKGHLRRNGKLPTALAEKNTLVRLGAGHPGIVRLHWTFQDEWSLCESCHGTTFPGQRLTRGMLHAQSSFSTLREMGSSKHEYRTWARCPLSVSAIMRHRLSTPWATCTRKALYTGELTSRVPPRSPRIVADNFRVSPEI